MKNQNALLLLSGRTISTLGDSIYQIAVIWYVYNLTHDTIYTGIAIACSSFPQVFHFLLGPLIEKSSKNTILKYSQLAQFFFMSLVPFSMILGYEHIYLVLFIILIVSFLENFQGTAEMSMVPSLVDEEHIGNYNSLNNSIQQCIHLLVAGLFSIIIIYVGIKEIYLFNAVTYFVAFIFFSGIKIARQATNSTPNEPKQYSLKHYKQDMQAGLTYFAKSKLLLITIPFVIANGMLSAVNAILPKYADFLGSSNYYGFLMFSISMGLLLGSLFSSSILKLPISKLFVILPTLTGLIWTFSIFQHNVWLSTVLLGISLIPFGMMNIVFLTMNQQVVHSNMLSRVLSISDSFLFISIPIGSLLGGYITSNSNPLAIMYLGGISFICIGAFYWIHPFLRKLPILKEIKLQF